MSKIKKILVAAAAGIAVIGVSSAAAAVISGATGTVTERQTFARNDVAQVITSGSFVDVAGGAVTVRVPAGQKRMLDARYTAETLCSGGGWCSARIVVTRTSPAGGTSELLPASGTDFSFDAPGDNWEGHALERTSNYLAAGVYRVHVQAAVVAGATSLRLDDTHLAVEVIRP